MSAERSLYGNDKGIALILVLMFVGAVALLGTVAVLMTSTDTKISGNYKASKKAMYVAEAGAQEARERLRGTWPTADGFPDVHHSANKNWTGFLGTNDMTVKKGWQTGNSNHIRRASLQSDLDYTVVIRHLTDDDDNVLYWGDDDPKDGV